MKKLLLLVLASLLVTLFPARADETKGMVNFENVDLARVLDIYHELSGLELTIDPQVSHSDAKITVRTESPVTKQEMAKLLEQALNQQAHLVITKLDGKHAAVKLSPPAAP